MPSHFAHLLHAEDSTERAFGRLAALPEPLQPFLVLGAQGPDLFYHNRRRKPSALLYGGMSHRKNYGKVVAGLVESALEHDTPLRSPVGAFTTGYLCHAVLDRKLHPYINYKSDLPDDRMFPRAHAFFERIIDMLLLERMRSTRPASIDFRALVDCGGELPAGIEAALTRGLEHGFDRASGDDELSQRLRNAYLDALGFYGYTNKVDAAAIRRAIDYAESERHERALVALMHPPRLPEGYDFANESHGRWCHPCDEREVHTESVYDLYEDAVRLAARLLHGLEAAWAGRIPLFDSDATAAEPSLEALVGNHNLSDERYVPCPRSCADPFPLRAIVDRIRAEYGPQT
jgi:hypothetical protein